MTKKKTNNPLPICPHELLDKKTLLKCFGCKIFETLLSFILKPRSAGRIRIGDQILAINQHFLHSLSSTEKSQTQSNLSNAFTNETIGNRRLKQRKRERRSTTALDLSLAQRDDDTCEVPGQITIWKSDIENVAAVSWSSLPSSSSSSSLSSSVFPTLVDRYENLIENTGDEEVCKELENYSTIIVTLLRQSPHMVLRSDWTQVEIIHLPNIPGVGLGFSIVGSTSSGVIVKTILPGSVAAKDKRLCPGDHILKIRGVSVHGMNPQQIAMLLRRQDVMVELVVGRPALYSDRSKDTENMYYDTTIIQHLFFIPFPGCWTMPTRDVLCRESFEEQIRKHSVLMPSGSNLLDVEGCENLNNNKNNKNNNNDDIATTINKSISILAKDPGPSQTVSAVIELTDSRQMQDDGTEPKNNEGIYENSAK
ncbi:unnamed protein product [Onchocerca ochengi]|uniref:PDZ domain-containing protein n=1 Tax=Onchocerca ochengi TaxID=42157 RepID=A0A182EB22_ONCOC|nr:unnamed protein product [Onchocerca ochengi]